MVMADALYVTCGALITDSYYPLLAIYFQKTTCLHKKYTSKVKRNSIPWLNKVQIKKMAFYAQCFPLALK